MYKLMFFTRDARADNPLLDVTDLADLPAMIRDRFDPDMYYDWCVQDDDGCCCTVLSGELYDACGDEVLKALDRRDASCTDCD